MLLETLHWWKAWWTVVCALKRTCKLSCKLGKSLLQDPVLIPCTSNILYRDDLQATVTFVPQATQRTIRSERDHGVGVRWPSSRGSEFSLLVSFASRVLLLFFLLDTSSPSSGPPEVSDPVVLLCLFLW